MAEHTNDSFSLLIPFPTPSKKMSFKNFHCSRSLYLSRLSIEICFWVRSFSRPEKLPLKIHTGSSGTFYSYWVEKALLFANWSSFSRKMPSPYVSNSCGFSLNPALRTHSSFLAVPARPAVNRSLPVHSDAN